MEFEKGKDYTYEQIEESVEASNEDFSLDILGEEIIGEHFIVVKSYNKTISFVLTGVRGDNYIYTCIFNQ